MQTIITSATPPRHRPYAGSGVLPWEDVTGFSVCCDDGVSRWTALSSFAQSALIALLAFAAGTVLYSTALYSLAPISAGVPVPIRLALLAAICGAAVFRRDRPVLAIWLATIPLGIDFALGPTLPIWLVFSDLVYAVVLYGTARQSRAMVGVAAAGTTVCLAIVLVLTRSWQPLVIGTIAAFAFVGTPLWWGRAVRLHKDVADSERARAEALTTIAALDRQAAIADERNRMARDLHDVIAGHLSAIAIQSEAALGITGQESDERLLRILESVRGNSIDALEEMRSMIGLLRTDIVDEAAAPGRLRQLAKLVDSAQAAGTEVAVLDDLAPGQLPTAVDHTAYRIAQEALTNAIKHAPGHPVELTLRSQSGQLLMTVSNPLPPRGFPSDPPRQRTGLTNMRERTELLGGRFSAGPAPDGWRVAVSIPVDGPAAGA
ncbi:signal transduction histidine kinase [Rhodococcus sp. PvR044]|jgi:signal transduction histidine kinase|nr:putative secreted protein with PEP-CTERM sorting signal [Rhodococcus sp. OK611]SNX90665.1 PEP-CTERM protein-sorting domain-containing protein [Rhodococcus sp. OK270]